ncbi:sulfatase-like hydrolase/transferase [Aeoliella mucimassa]|nr:sulfatase-like hydrolase/transferase [Aeoliella mucimassa]
MRYAPLESLRPTLLMLALALLASTQVLAADTRPNIVVLLADDLGYGDVGFHGSSIRTPNLDQLAATGVTLERYYVAPMCSPTRAGLMTGRYPIRFGMMRSVVPPYRDFGLDPAEVTIADMLATAGYEHRAVIGKWHLGHRRTKWLPGSQGFTHAVGCYNGAIDYFTHQRDGQLDWHRNGQPDLTEGYVTDMVGDAAVEFIEGVPLSEPYLLYVPFTAPHSPFQAKDEDLAKYPKLKGKQKTYAAMVDSLDQAIGRILTAIDERGDAENTFVLFSSDNGGVASVGSNGPLKGHKLTPYEGGVRVAAAARWPQGQVVGGRTIEQPMGYLDVFPTLMQVAEVSETPGHPLDGVGMLPTLQGDTTPVERPWYTYMDQNGGRRQHVAVHHGPWKLVGHRPAPDAAQGKTVYELYRLADDPNETTDVAEQHPEVVEQLKESLERFFSWQAAQQVPRYDEGRDELPPLENWTPRE